MIRFVVAIAFFWPLAAWGQQVAPEPGGSDVRPPDLEIEVPGQGEPQKEGEALPVPEGEIIIPKPPAAAERPATDNIPLRGEEFGLEMGDRGVAFGLDMAHRGIAFGMSWLDGNRSPRAAREFGLDMARRGRAFGLKSAERGRAFGLEMRDRTGSISPAEVIPNPRAMRHRGQAFSRRVQQRVEQFGHAPDKKPAFRRGKDF